MIKLKNNYSLKQKYPWLNIVTTIKNYIEPSYYDKLLKEYIFNNQKDLELFEDYIRDYIINNHIKAIELGCGNGRATKIFLKNIDDFELSVVDLSPRMIQSTKNQFINYKNIYFLNSDTIQFLENTKDIYDFIFSLWSFSHAIHQLLNRVGLEKGAIKIKYVIEKMVRENMKKGSRFFLIHFDSLSEEQRILIKQWRRVYPIFLNNKIQSPSKRILDKLFKNLEKTGIINLSIKHFIGKAIEYTSIDEALEIFMNFHLESYFNESSLVEEVIKDLVGYFKKFQTKNGLIKIKPGCFVYSFEKN